MSMSQVRSGQHKTIFGVKRDPRLTDKNVIRDRSQPTFPFIGADQYKGGWENNLKSGFGTLVTERSRYEGEFRYDKRDGLGTLWLRNGGEKGGPWRKVYHGGWRNGKRHGEGTSYHANGDVYVGGWSEDCKDGRGTIRFSNGDLFTGTFKGNMRNGPGVLHFSSGDIYRGHYRDDLKDGPGIYFYKSTVKVYEGEWFEDQPRCGEIRDPTAFELKSNFIDEGSGIASGFEMPELELLRPQAVLAEAVAAVRLMRSSSFESESVGLEPEPFDAASLERARSMFSDLDVDGRGAVSAEELQAVLCELDVQAGERALAAVLGELGLDEEDSRVSFPDALDIANMLRGREESGSQ